MEPFFARTAEMAVRLATIRAVGINPENPAVSVDDIAWGCEIALWSAERMANDVSDLASETPWGKIDTKIIGMLKAAKGRPVKERVLYKSLGISAKELKTHVKDLSDMGRILPVTVENRGKFSKAWKLVANDNRRSAAGV